jgi:hypothetical protein
MKKKIHFSKVVFYENLTITPKLGNLIFNGNNNASQKYRRDRVK